LNNFKFRIWTKFEFQKFKIWTKIKFEQILELNKIQISNKFRI
jgi:hypothetical protein